MVPSANMFCKSYLALWNPLLTFRQSRGWSKPPAPCQWLLVFLTTCCCKNTPAQQYTDHSKVNNLSARWHLVSKTQICLAKKALNKLVVYSKQVRNYLEMMASFKPLYLKKKKKNKKLQYIAVFKRSFSSKLGTIC